MVNGKIHSFPFLINEAIEQRFVQWSKNTIFLYNKYFLNKNSSYPALINKVINNDDVDKKPLIQIGLLILIEIVKYCNKKDININ